MNKPLNIPVIPRHPHRTWLTPKGEVITEPAPHATQDADPVRELHFNARVLDTSTEEVIADYPELEGSVSLHKGDSLQHQAEQTYYGLLRWADNKPDVETLQKNVNAGIWSVEVDTEVDTPAPVLND